MNAQQHSDICNKMQQKYRDTLAAYEREHPHYCRKCGGQGAKFVEYDPSPAGVSLSPGYMVDIEPCTECVEQGKCPRCGASDLPWDEEAVWDAQDACPHCGWAWGKNSDDYAPQQPECSCWERRRDDDD